MNNEVQGDKATTTQIKKLYAVLYNNGIEPREFLENERLESFSQLRKEEISNFIDDVERGTYTLNNVLYEEQEKTEVIDDLEMRNYNHGPQEEADKRQEEADEADKGNKNEDHVEGKGELLKKCLDEAIEIVADTPAINGTMHEYQKASIIIDLAKTLFDSCKDK